MINRGLFLLAVLSVHVIRWLLSMNEEDSQRLMSAVCVHLAFRIHYKLHWIILLIAQGNHYTFTASSSLIYIRSLYTARYFYRKKYVLFKKKFNREQENSFNYRFNTFNWDKHANTILNICISTTVVRMYPFMFYIGIPFLLIKQRRLLARHYTLLNTDLITQFLLTLWSEVSHWLRTLA